MKSVKTRFIYAYYVLTEQVSYPKEQPLVDAFEKIYTDYVDTKIINLNVWKEMKLSKVVIDYLNAQGKEQLWQGIGRLLPMEYDNLYEETIDMIVASKHLDH